MLYPMFENSSGEQLINETEKAPDTETAAMTMPMFPENREYTNMLRERVIVGAEGYFVAGGTKLTKVKIIEILTNI